MGSYSWLRYKLSITSGKLVLRNLLLVVLRPYIDPMVGVRLILLMVVLWLLDMKARGWGPIKEWLRLLVVARV